MAAVSFLSLSGVPVPWVEIRIWDASRAPAWSSAAPMAVTAPSRLGWVQWKASEERPTPASSATILAPRARAWSRDSRIRAAAPSPMAMPSRPAENGRQVVGLMAFRPSQARRQVGVAMASLPPTRAASAWPEAIKLAPWAMAWPEEEQALETANTGPLTPNSMETALTGALTMTLGTVIGCMRAAFWP